MARTREPAGGATKFLARACRPWRGSGTFEAFEGRNSGARAAIPSGAASAGHADAFRIPRDLAHHWPARLPSP